MRALQLAAAFAIGSALSWYVTRTVYREEAIARGHATMSWYDDGKDTYKVFRWK